MKTEALSGLIKVGEDSVALDSVNKALGAALHETGARANRTNTVPYTADTPENRPEPVTTKDKVSGASAKYWANYANKNWLQRNEFMRSMFPGVVDLFDNYDDRVNARASAYNGALSSWFLRRYEQMPKLPEDGQWVHHSNGISITKPVPLVDIYDYVASNYVPPKPAFLQKFLYGTDAGAFALDNDVWNPNKPKKPVGYNK